MLPGRGGPPRGSRPPTRGRTLTGKIVFVEDLDAARVKAAEAEASRVKAQAEAEEARVKAAEAEAASVKAEAEAEAARVKAAETEAVHLKAKAEAEAARVKAEAEAQAKAEAEAQAKAEAEAARLAAVQKGVREHMEKMKEINKRMGFKAPPPPPPPPPYRILDNVANFPSGYDYYAQPPERPRIELSPEAQEYENRERELANQLESDAQLDSRLDSLQRGMGGGRKKKSTRQKKQHHRRNRRRSTRKYRK